MTEDKGDMNQNIYQNKNIKQEEVVYLEQEKDQEDLMKIENLISQDQLQTQGIDQN